MPFSLFHSFFQPLTSTRLVEVTGDLVAAGYLDQLRLSHRTLRHGKGTTGVEVATRWGIESAGYLTREDDLLLRLVGVRGQGGGKQGLRVRVQGLGTQLNEPMMKKEFLRAAQTARELRQPVNEKD
jgi:hypothetical protein